MTDTEQRIEYALDALGGLSVGDAFGECFFDPSEATIRRILSLTPPPAPWYYTDDTEMAMSVVETLAHHGRVEPDSLAARFARRFVANPHRGYGLAAQSVLAAIASGTPWRETSSSQFRGSGSFGNGAAMRVAPLGAFFHDDLSRCADEARLSAEVTHYHPEGQAGAVAVAVAAAMAVRTRDVPAAAAREAIWNEVLARTPDGETRGGLEAAVKLSPATAVDEAVEVLGNGSRISAQDTVPFTVWVALSELDSYKDALWTAVLGMGDIDTTCAIVGGIVAGRLGRGGIPDAWLEAREPLPDLDF